MRGLMLLLVVMMLLADDEGAARQCGQLPGGHGDEGR